MSSIVPPLVIDVCVRRRGERDIRIWLPFFLIWPLFLPIVLFALAVTAVVDLALSLAGAKYHSYTLLLIGVMQLLAEVRGTHAHIVDSDSNVYVDII